MSTAETAELVADLEMRDHMSAPAAAATAKVDALEGATNRAQTSAVKAGGAFKGAGNALGHLKQRALDVSKVVGAVGLFGGVLAGVEFMKHSVEAATSWGRTVERLNAITGLGTQRLSQFSDAFDKLGVTAGTQERIIAFMQKTLGTLNATTGGAKKVQEQYGFSILDSKGKVKDALTVIQDFTNYFNNKTIPASQKAALGAKLFGRSWTDLLPIFEMGKAKMQDAMDSAMVMTDDQYKDLIRLRDAQRDWNDAIGDLEVQIGLIAVPALADLASAGAKFVDEHQKDITAFFKDALDVGKRFAGFVVNEALPTIKSLLGAAMGLWNGIPEPLRDLLVKGFIADKTIKFLFGIDPGKIAAGAIGDAIGGGIKGILGNLFQRGGPGNPMFVAVEGGGLGGGGGVPTGGGSSLLSKVAIIGSVAIAASSIYLLVQQLGTFMQTTAQAQHDLQIQADDANRQDSAEALANLKKLNSHLAGLSGLDRMLADTFGGKQEADALENLSAAVTRGSHFTTAQLQDAIHTLQAAQVQAQARGNTKVATSIGNDIAVLQGRLAGQGATQNGLLADIAAKPTNITVPVTTTVNSTVSVRDTSASVTTFHRYGYSVA